MLNSLLSINVTDVMMIMMMRRRRICMVSF